MATHTQTHILVLIHVNIFCSMRIKNQFLQSISLSHHTHIHLHTLVFIHIQFWNPKLISPKCFSLFLFHQTHTQACTFLGSFGWKLFKPWFISLQFKPWHMTIYLNYGTWQFIYLPTINSCRTFIIS